MRGSSKHPRVEPSSVAPPPPSSTSDTMAEESIDPTVATDVPPPSTSDDSNIRRMLETVMFVQAAHGQILVDMLDELHVLREDLEHLRWSPPPSLFDDRLWLPFGIPSQKGGVHM